MTAWRKIDGRPNYSVSDRGDVRNDTTGRVMRLSRHRCGYLTVMLGRKTTPLYAHRLVAIAFVPNPGNKPQVDHVNGDKGDNRAENLRWVTPSENCRGFGHSSRIENRRKRVVASNGDRTVTFDSRDDAATFFGCSKSQIRYGWRYKRGAKRGWVLSLAKDIV